MATESTDTRNRAPEGEPEVVRLELGPIGPTGDATANLGGETIDVFGGIPGEEVAARVIRFRRRRRQQVSAFVVEVVTPSPHRITPPCPYVGPCSGCQWQHIDYPYQLVLKRESVERELRKYASLDGVPLAGTLAAPEPFRYRNHARFTVRRQGTLGFVNRITRHFVQVDDCMLMTPGINDALRQLQGRCAETSQLSIRYGVNTSDRLIQPTLRSDAVPLPSGQTHYRERLMGKTFRIASPSFFQTNTRQAERLIGLVRDRLELSGRELVVDAYAGVGTFGVLLAPSVRRVIAVEESEAAVADAERNAEGVPNLEFRLGRAEDVLGTLEQRPDVVIIDPPRAGCRPEALQAVMRWRPRRVAYVSCDPETLARDLDVLVRGGLSVETVEPVDMFPQTHHVECVATLSSPHATPVG